MFIRAAALFTCAFIFFIFFWLSKSAFDSQVMAVIQHCDGHGTPYHIYVGDRWNVGPGKKGIEHAG